MPPIVQPISASLALGGNTRITFICFIRARLRITNTHMYIIGSFLRIMRAFDQLIRPFVEANIIKLAPDTFESNLPNRDYFQLIHMRNQTALVTYDLAHNTRTVSESYYDE